MSSFLFPCLQDFIGRFDFLWDGEGEPKLAEYNADTPTVLVESAAAQRQWCAEVHPHSGQFNVLQEALEAGWYDIATRLLARHRAALYSYPQHALEGDAPIRLSLEVVAQGVLDMQPNLYSLLSDYSFAEEGATAVYMEQRAAAAGKRLESENRGVTVRTILRTVDSLTTKTLCEPSSDTTSALSRAKAKQPPPTRAMWKLYPWEWIIHEDIGSVWDGQKIHSSAYHEPLAQLYEPPWKLIMSSKAMLAYLWSKYPEHPNLLPAAMSDDLSNVGGGDTSASNWVSKPSFGREGHGLLYGDEAHIDGDANCDMSLSSFAESVTKSSTGKTHFTLYTPWLNLPDMEGFLAAIKERISGSVEGASSSKSDLLDRPALTMRTTQLVGAWPRTAHKKLNAASTCTVSSSMIA